MKEVKKDIFQKTPIVGDIIVFNPPKYKGLVAGNCIGFTNSGCPKINSVNNTNYWVEYDIKKDGFYSVKTEFCIK